MPDAISPVDDPRSYQELLLGLAGPGDPAAALEATIPELRSLVTEAGGDLRTRPAEAEWSVIELVGHMLDAEMVSTTRLRWILAQDRPDLPGYDQDGWVAALGYAGADPARLISTWDALRRANIELWRSTPSQLRSRAGVHRERGDESFELTARLLAGHDRFHIEQARRALEQIRL
jgi:hypothetical protein